MFKRPIVFGIDGRMPMQTSSFDDRMMAFGHNTGNVFFSEALYRVLGNARRASYAPRAQAFEGRDVIIIAAANWINSYSDFGWLADRIERSQLPVLMVGLGAQAAFGEATPAMSPGTDRLLRIVAERSAAISVRGVFTADVLARYGITNVVVTGCPSLLLAGRHAPKAARPDSLSWERCAMHATRGHFDKGDALQRYLYRQAMRHDVDLVLQAEAPELMLCWGAASDIQRVEEVLSDCYGRPAADVRTYIDKRARVFSTEDEWVSALSQKSFSIGTRFHGTIAALLAGINATLITHDTRTAEMAEVMNIPVVAGAAIDQSRDLEPLALYSEEAMHRFESGYARYLRTFLGFFGVNKVMINSDHFTPSRSAGV